MNLHSHFKPRTGVLWRELAGVVIVLDGTTGRYFKLDGSAASIWRLINRDESLASIVESSSQGYDDQRERIATDVFAFVETAVSDGLLETAQEPAHGHSQATSLAPTLQITASRLFVNGSTDGLRQQFARDHHIHLPQMIEPGLLKMIRDQVEGGQFVDRTHHGIGTEECLVPGTATSILQLVFNDPALLEAISDIAGCGRVKCFDGRVYRMAPAAGHYDSWHSDAGEDRQVAVSINLSPEPYEGGVLEIRPASSTEASHVVANPGFGNAVMFRISPALRHRVSAVTGAHPRTAYAGWFRSAPDFQDLFFASLPKQDS